MPVLVYLFWRCNVDRSRMLVEVRLPEAVGVAEEGVEFGCPGEEGVEAFLGGRDVEIGEIVGTGLEQAA